MVRLLLAAAPAGGWEPSTDRLAVYAYASLGHHMAGAVDPTELMEDTEAQSWLMPTTISIMSGLVAREAATVFGSKALLKLAEQAEQKHDFYTAGVMVACVTQTPEYANESINIGAFQASDPRAVWD